MAEDKKKTTPLTWIVSIAVWVVVFLVVKNGIEGKPYLLFEGSANKRERIVEECNWEAQEKAIVARDRDIKILKKKNDPTPYDLEEIERLEIWQSEGVFSRDDKDYYFKECMKKYGY